MPVSAAGRRPRNRGRCLALLHTRVICIHITIHSFNLTSNVSGPNVHAETLFLLLLSQRVYCRLNQLLLCLTLLLKKELASVFAPLLKKDGLFTLKIRVREARAMREKTRLLSSLPRAREVAMSSHVAS